MKRLFQTFGLGLWVYSLACTPSRNSAQDWPQGKAVWPQGPQGVLLLSVHQRSPQAQNSWSVRLRWDAERSHWSIETAPDGKELIDRLADSGRVSHILDSLQGMKVLQPAASGRLGSFGLDPPRYKLQAETEFQVLEAEMGNPDSVQSGFYVRVRRYSKLDQRFQDWSPVLLVTGGANSLLATWEKVDDLRKSAWLAYRVDDVDEVEIIRSSKPKRVWHFERQGDDWVDLSKHGKPKLTWNLTEMLERLVHTPITRFVDNPEENQKNLKILATQADYRIKTSGRRLKDEARVLFGARGSTIGMSSQRGAASFELSPRLRETLGALR